MKNYKRMRFLVLPIFLAVFSIAALLVMLLWNCLVPAIFNGVTITFWQSAGLIILSRLLLGGFGKWAGHHHRHAHTKAEGWQHFAYMRNALKGMSRNERREFIRKHMEDHHGYPRRQQEGCGSEGGWNTPDRPGDQSDGHRPRDCRDEKQAPGQNSPKDPKED